MRIQPGTLTRYNNACRTFFSHLQHNHLELPVEVEDFDFHVCVFIEDAWEEGQTRNLAADVLSGLQFHVPGLRHHLPAAWALLTAWKKAELPCRAVPLSPEQTLALAGLALKWGRIRLAIMLLLGFHCLLRTDEIISLQCRDVRLGVSGEAAVLALNQGKSGKRRGLEEAVTVTDAGLVTLLTDITRQLMPGDFILDCPPRQFRDDFRSLCHTMGLPSDQRWLPYSLRRGGATSHFRLFGSFDATADRGRWASIRTARLYISDALSMQAHLTLPPTTVARINSFAGHCLKALGVGSGGSGRRPLG